MYVQSPFVTALPRHPFPADLKYKLQEAQFQHNQPQHQPSYQHGRFMSSGSASGPSVASMSPPERPPSSSLYPSPSPPQAHSNIVLPRASLNLSPDCGDHSRFGTNSDLPPYDVAHSASQQTLKPDPFMDLLFLGWNSDLPEPVVLNRLCVILFNT